MTAVVIDLKDFFTRTPQQAVRVFLSSYNPETIEAALFDIFKVCAIAGKENNEPGFDVQATADLFDHIIAMTRAIHEFGDGEMVTCPLCGQQEGRGG